MLELELELELELGLELELELELEQELGLELELELARWPQVAKLEALGLAPVPGLVPPRERELATLAPVVTAAAWKGVLLQIRAPLRPCPPTPTARHWGRTTCQTPSVTPTGTNTHTHVRTPAAKHQGQVMHIGDASTTKQATATYARQEGVNPRHGPITVAGHTAVIRVSLGITAVRAGESWMRCLVPPVVCTSPRPRRRCRARHLLQRWQRSSSTRRRSRGVWRGHGTTHPRPAGRGDGWWRHRYVCHNTRGNRNRRLARHRHGCRRAWSTVWRCGWGCIRCYVVMSPAHHIASAIDASIVTPATVIVTRGVRHVAHVTQVVTTHTIHTIHTIRTIRTIHSHAVAA